MYSQESTFITERPVQKLGHLRNNKSHMNLRQPTAQPPITSNIRTRNVSNDPYSYNNNSNLVSLSEKALTTANDYPSEPLRGYMPQQLMGNMQYQPYSGNQSVFPYYSREPAVFPSHHSRQNSHGLVMNNNMSSPYIPTMPQMNPIQPLTASWANQQYQQFPNPYSPKMFPEPSRKNNMADEKVLKFLERQNQVIEKLAMRIQQEEIHDAEKERRNLEKKLLKLENQKHMMHQEKSTGLINNNNNNIYQQVQNKLDIERQRTIEAERQRLKSKEKPNTLEQLGKLYLMSQVIDGNFQPKKSSSTTNKSNYSYSRKANMQNDSNNIYEDDGSRVPNNFKLKTLQAPVNLTEGHNRRRAMLPGQFNFSQFEEFEEYDIYGPKFEGIEVETRKPKNGKKGKTFISAEALELLPAHLRRQAEDGKVRTVQRTKAAKGRLRGVLWGMIYGNLLLDDVQKKVEKRKHEIQSIMSDNIQSNSNVAQEFMLSVGDQFIRELVKESKPLDLYIEGKNISAGDLDGRVAFIFGKLKSFFDKLIVGTTNANLNNNLLRFLASISEDSGVLPNNFMFDFEIKRLQFTYYATLKNMTPQKSKMVIGLFILLRILVHKMIMRPWTVLIGIKDKDVKVSNLKVIGSILYHTVLDFYKSNVPICQNNQIFLPVDMKIKPRNAALKATDAEPEVDEKAMAKKKDDKNKEPEPILGFYTKEQLKSLFVDRKKQADELKALVDGWLEKIYQLTHEIYKKTPIKDRETLGVPV